MYPQHFQVFSLLYTAQGSSAERERFEAFISAAPDGGQEVSGWKEDAELPGG